MHSPVPNRMSCTETVQYKYMYCYTLRSSTSSRLGRQCRQYPKFQISKFHLFSSNETAAEKDLRSMGVPPNRTFTYVWKVTPDDGPLDGDPQCLTQLYQSTVSPEKDLASGLVGALLICKNEAIDTRGRLVRSTFT